MYLIKGENMNDSINNNTAGICWIAFKEGSSDSAIQEAITKFYLDNKSIIEGMEFNLLVDVISMNEGKRIAEKFWKRKEQ